jgi:hypothetical protein
VSSARLNGSPDPQRRTALCCPPIEVRERDWRVGRAVIGSPECCARRRTFGLESVPREPRLIVTGTVVARALAAILDQLLADRRKASSGAMAKNPVRLPLRTADKANEGHGLDADLSLNSEAVALRPLKPPPQRSKLDEFKGAVSEASARYQFRIQFLGGVAGEGPEIVKEAQVCAPNVFGAFRAAEHSAWPPGATGLRILDSGGREVFWRRKHGTDNGYKFRLLLSSENSTADQYGPIMK